MTVVRRPAPEPALVARHRAASHYLRPTLGTGVLGGWTTFSTYEVETVLRLDHGKHHLVGRQDQDSRQGSRAR